MKNLRLGQQTVVHRVTERLVPEPAIPDRRIRDRVIPERVSAGRLVLAGQPGLVLDLRVVRDPSGRNGRFGPSVPPRVARSATPG